MFERAEVVFPVRVVVLGEIVEQFHLLADGGLSGRRQSTVPLRLKHAPRYCLQFNGHPLGLRLLALTVAQRGDGDPSRLIQQIFDAAELSDEIPLERKLKHLMEFYERGMPRTQVALMGIVSFFRSVAPKQTILALARNLPAVAEATKTSSDTELEDALAALSHQHLLIGDPAQEAWSCQRIWT
jgi:hypothetical protein